jgi:hypothetical protein
MRNLSDRHLYPSSSIREIEIEPHLTMRRLSSHSVDIMCNLPVTPTISEEEETKEGRENYL